MFDDTQDCEVCSGEGWVCSEHPGKAWGDDGDGCCGADCIRCLECQDEEDDDA